MLRIFGITQLTLNLIRGHTQMIELFHYRVFVINILEMFDYNETIIGIFYRHD